MGHSYQTRGSHLDMVYIQAVCQFDKTHNVNFFLAFICGRASLRCIFLFICSIWSVFFFFLVQRREIVIWDLRISYVSDFKYQRLDLKNNYEFTSGS